MNKQWIAAALVIGSLTGFTSAADPLFTSAIDNLPNGTTLTGGAGGNTNFTNVYGAVTAQTPGISGSGTSATVLSGTQNAGNHLQQTLGSQADSFSLMSLSVDLNIQDSANGHFHVYMGNGNTVRNVGNNNLNYTHVMWYLRIDSSGNLQYATGNSDNITPLLETTVTTLSDLSSYNLFIQVNGSDSAVEYESGKFLAADSMNVFLDGMLILENIDILNNTSTASAMRIGAAGSNGDYRVDLDNIQIWDSVQPIHVVPEPATTALLLGAAASSVFFLRRRRGAKNR